MIDDCRHPVVRADFQKLRFELIALTNIHRNGVIRQTALFEHNRNLVSVRGGPVIEIYHANSIRCSANDVEHE